MHSIKVCKGQRCRGSEWAHPVTFQCSSFILWFQLIQAYPLKQIELDLVLYREREGEKNVLLIQMTRNRRVCCIMFPVWKNADLCSPAVPHWRCVFPVVLRLAHHQLSAELSASARDGEKDWGYVCLCFHDFQVYKDRVQNSSAGCWLSVLSQEKKGICVHGKKWRVKKEHRWTPQPAPPPASFLPGIDTIGVWCCYICVKYTFSCKCPLIAESEVISQWCHSFTKPNSHVEGLQTDEFWS